MPGRRLAREADDDSERLAGQVPCRWQSRLSEGLGLGCGPDREEDGLARGNELLAAAAVGEQLTRGEDLVLAWLDDSGFGNEQLPYRGTKATDGIVRGQHLAHQRGGSETTGRVDERAD